jgi:hypothetical protein
MSASASAPGPDSHRYTPVLSDGCEVDYSELIGSS